MGMPYVFRAIDGQYFDLSAPTITDFSGAQHTHASAAQGGQLDWDTVWADAVHSHASDAEGGATLTPGSVAATGTVAAGSFVFSGAAGTGTGGNFRAVDDGGTSRWLMGITGSAGDRAWRLYDLDNNAVRLEVHQTTGLLSVNNGLTGAGTVDLTGATVSIDDLTNIQHTHANTANGGQLDWDTAFSDAVHSHQSNAEGGALDGAAITTTVTGSGNVVKATGPTVTTLTVSSGVTTLAGGLDVDGSATGFSGGEIRYTDTGTGRDYGLVSLGSGAAAFYFQHRTASNTGFWVWGNGTDGATQRMRLGATGDLTIEGDIDHNGTEIGFYGTAPAAKPTVTGSRGANAALASLLTGLAGLGLLTDSSSA